MTIKPIQIFNRHCAPSIGSINKERPPWFSRQNCLHNLKRTANPALCDLHFFYDEHRGSLENHFLWHEQNVQVVNAGTEPGASIKLLDYLVTLAFSDETIIYLVEDDYLHRRDWSLALVDAFHYLDKDHENYFTLYDHSDKYTLDMYRELKSSVVTTSFSHWRTIPSTTCTFAVRFGTLKRDIEIHKRLFPQISVSPDHQRFLELTQNMGRKLFCPIPGLATHVETAYLSPLIDWRYENY